MTELERIKQSHKSQMERIRESRYPVPYGAHPYDIEWLIERVEEWEEEIQRLKVWYGAYNRQAKHSQKLSEENQRYKQALEDIRNRESLTTGLPDGQRAFTMSGAIANKALEDEE